MKLGVSPAYESWFAEKSASLVEHLARALAAHALIEDKTVRGFIGGSLEAALFQAMKITSAGLDDEALFTPGLETAVRKNPDAALQWLRSVRSRDKAEKARTRPPDEIVERVKRELDEARMIDA